MNFNQISYSPFHWKGSKHHMYQAVQCVDRLPLQNNWWFYSTRMQILIRDWNICVIHTFHGKVPRISK